MKRFQCQCGQRVFFENVRCGNCGRRLGFEPETLSLLTLQPSGDAEHRDASGLPYRSCRNQDEHDICNWLVPVDSGESYCVACRRNAVIPNLSDPRNLTLWSRLELAKRRLLYTLLSIGLPLDGAGGGPSMAFRFMEDQRANPLVEEAVVVTGHHSGIITINLAEADDSVRHAVREAMRERYRTLLGHFRHESGHYYFEAATAHDIDDFRQLFGDERSDYDAAMARYYDSPGARPDWPAHFISEYASAHPLEDWAESWAHYLHIVDTLETAAACGVIHRDVTVTSQNWLATWMELSVTLNELNRSMGADDVYPFVLSSRAADKLDFIHRRVERMAAGTAAAGDD